MPDLSFPVLQSLSTSRSTHGLRSNDYERYQSHLSGKIQRLRKGCGLGQGSGGSKGGKDGKGTKGGYKKVEVPEGGRVLQLLLLESERAYTTSQSLHHRSTRPNPNPDASKGALKRDEISRLRKAIGWSEKLVQLGTKLAQNQIQAQGQGKDEDKEQGKEEQAGNPTPTTPCYISQKTLTELHIHHLSLLSTLHFLKSSYPTTLPLLLAQHRLLTLLSRSARTSPTQALYDSLVEPLGALIRFCAYKLGRQRGKGGGSVGVGEEVEEIVREFGVDDLEESYPGLKGVISGFEREREEERGAERAGQMLELELERIVWAGEEVRVKSPEVVRSLIKVQQAIKALAQISAAHKNKPASGETSTESASSASASVSQATFEWNQSISRRPSGKGLKKWDNLLSALSEAEILSRRQAALSSHRDDEGSSSLLGGGGAGGSAGVGIVPGTAEFTHQWVTYLLLSYRVRRDLIIIKGIWTPSIKQVIDTINSTTSKPKSNKSVPSSNNSNNKPHKSNTNSHLILPAQKGLPKPKRDQALRNLQKVLKLWDAVLQSLEQAEGLGIVLEREEEVGRGLKGLEGWARGIRNLKLAEMHALLPSPSYPSSIHLTSRSSISFRQATQYLTSEDASSSPSSSTNTLPFRPRDGDLGKLQSQLQDLDNGIKRAWFNATNKKPIFYDLAFNYIDLPMEELERAAGREPTVHSEPEVEAGVQGMVESVVERLPAAVKAPVEKLESAMGVGKGGGVPASRGRESTPALEDKPEGQGQQETPSKSGGWFGGLWGGRK